MFSRIIITIILTLGFSLSLQSVLAAWVQPTDTPPRGNQNYPIYNANILDPETNALIDSNNVIV